MSPIPSIALLLAAAVPAPSLDAPPGTPVALDGAISQAEWGDGASLEIPGGYRLYAKYAGDDLLLALLYPEPTFVGVDIYVDAPDGSLFNMHASAQLGQRVPQGEGWTPWTWGNNAGWDSHVTRRTADRSTFESQQGREFRISRALLAAPELHLRIALNDERTLVWPNGTGQHDVTGWARIRLPRL